jgi:hypothetical protein
MSVNEIRLCLTRTDLKSFNSPAQDSESGTRRKHRSSVAWHSVRGGPPTGIKSASPGATSHMLRKHTSTQRNRAAANLPWRRRVSAPLRSPNGRKAKATGRNGRTLDGAAPAPVIVNQTKLAIVAVMQPLDGPVSSIGLQKIWAEHKALEIFEYHLSTLVKARVVEMVFGCSELHFRLAREA